MTRQIDADLNRLGRYYLRVCEAIESGKEAQAMADLAKMQFIAQRLWKNLQNALRLAYDDVEASDAQEARQRMQETLPDDCVIERVEERDDDYMAEGDAYAEICRNTLNVFYPKRLAEAWRAQWPNHCRACGGWGGHNYPATGPSYSCGGEPEGFDLCEELNDYQCHRCGAFGALDDDRNGPCNKCGWNYDDGVPSL
jgi:hypothetical protein